MRPHLDDARLQVFADWVTKVQDELGVYFRRILEGRTSARPMVARVLNELADVTRSWAQRTLEEVATEADRQAADALGSNKTVYYGHILNSLQMELTDRLSRARVAVMASANKLSRHPILAQKIEHDFTTVPIGITGASGRSYNYSFDYYTTMVAHTVCGRLRSAVTIHRAASEDYPYVQVVGVADSDTDYCKAYEGRVFDIKEDKNIYPHLSRTPSGGPPFHPWCNHTVQIYTPTSYIPPEMDERFLLAEGETNHYGIIKRWKEHVG